MQDFVLRERLISSISMTMALFVSFIDISKQGGGSPQIWAARATCTMGCLFIISKQNYNIQNASGEHRKPNIQGLESDLN